MGLAFQSNFSGNCNLSALACVSASVSTYQMKIILFTSHFLTLKLTKYNFCFQIGEYKIEESETSLSRFLIKCVWKLFEEIIKRALLGISLLKTVFLFTKTNWWAFSPNFQSPTSTESLAKTIQLKVKQDCSYQGEALNVPTAF